MKKKEILELINAKQIIAKNQNLLSTIQNNIFNYVHYESEKFWFPNIPELKDYFDILKKELMDAKNQTEEAENTIKQTKCTHEVRLNYHSLFISTNTCVLCGHHASSDNCISFKESLYRNKHTVTFSAKYQEDDDGPYEVKDGKTSSELLEIITSILNNYELDSEIDLVQEFSKLDLKGMTLNQETRKQENYILIIGGTNRQYIDKNKEVYLSQKRKLDSTNFIKYFNGVLNTKIAVIEQKDVLKQKDIKQIEKDDQRIFFQDYNTLDGLDSALYQVENIPFKLIIDLTELYDYQLQDENVTYSTHELNLKEQFPNSHIIRIRPLDEEKIEVEEALKQANINEIYQTNEKNPEYYYLDQEEVKKKDTEETCNHLKMLLRK